MPKKPLQVKEPVLPKTEVKPIKIAVCGTASYSLLDVPFEDKDWKIWSLCYNYNKFKRGDKWFEIHHEDVLTQAGLHPQAIEDLQKFKSDVIAFGKTKMFPEATPFPFQLCIQQFPRKYFTSSISWMLALAILTVQAESTKHGVMGEISIHGVHMTDTDEYAFQKGAIEYLVGYCDAKGIKVTVDRGSPICRTPRMYAYEDVGISRELVQRRKDRQQEMNQREENYLRERDLYHYNKGRLAEVNEIANNWR